MGWNHQPDWIVATPPSNSDQKNHHNHRCCCRGGTFYCWRTYGEGGQPKSSPYPYPLSENLSPGGCTLMDDAHSFSFPGASLLSKKRGLFPWQFFKVGGKKVPGTWKSHVWNRKKHLLNYLILVFMAVDAIPPFIQFDHGHVGPVRHWEREPRFQSSPGERPPVFWDDQGIQLWGGSGSTIRTLLNGKINPKDWQVLSLGDVGFLLFFRVVSGDYGKLWGLLCCKSLGTSTMEGLLC